MTRPPGLFSDQGTFWTRLDLCHRLRHPPIITEPSAFRVATFVVGLALIALGILVGR